METHPTGLFFYSVSRYPSFYPKRTCRQKEHPEKPNCSSGFVSSLNRHPVGCLFLFMCAVKIPGTRTRKGASVKRDSPGRLSSSERSKPTECGGAGRQTCLTNGKAWAAKSLMAHQIKRQVIGLSQTVDKVSWIYHYPRGFSFVLG